MEFTIPTIMILGTIIAFIVFLFIGRNLLKNNPDAQKLLELSTQGGEVPDEWIQEVKKPSDTGIKLARSDNGLEFTVPKLGLRQGSGDRVTFGTIMVLFLGFVFLAKSIYEISIEGFSALSENLVFLIGGTIMFFPVLLNCFKHASITVEGEQLSITYRGTFRTFRGSWHASEIKGIWADEWPSGIWAAKRGNHPSEPAGHFINPPEMNVPWWLRGGGEDVGWYDCMYVMPKVGKPFVILVGWEMEELLWIRKELMEHLGIVDETD